MSYFLLFISAAFVNNFVFVYFLGICSFVGVSNKISTALSMGFAVTFVLTISAATTWILNHYLLVPYQLDYLQSVSFILVIATLVQLVEMFIRKVSAPTYESLGIFLPLITTNCAVLGLALMMVLRNYNFVESIIFAVGTGAGYTTAIVIMAGIRENLDDAPVPKYLNGAGIAMIIAASLAMGFMGFSGI